MGKKGGGKKSPSKKQSTRKADKKSVVTMEPVDVGELLPTSTVTNTGEVTNAAHVQEKESGDSEKEKTSEEKVDTATEKNVQKEDTKEEDDKDEPVEENKTDLEE